MEALQRFIRNTMAAFSIGAYRALVSGVASASQVLVDPDWLGAPVRARTVESPILDIVPKDSTPMAVVCQDGVHSFPMAIGQIKEEGASDAMTAWVRADLRDAPDDIEVGGDGVTKLGTSGSKSGVATLDTTVAALGAHKTALDAAIDTYLAITPPSTPVTQATLVPLLTAFKAYLAAEQSAAAFSSSVTAST